MNFKPELYGQFDTLDHEMLRQNHKKDLQINQNEGNREEEAEHNDILFQKRTN